MNRLFSRKPKKSLKHSQRVLGIPTNIAAGPLGFRAELDTSPKGEKNRDYQDLEADLTDSTVALGKNNNKGLQIVFQGTTGEGQALPAPEISTPDAVVSGADHGGDPPSERFRSLPSALTFIWISMSLHTRRGRR